MRATTLRRDPTTPTAVTFRDILLSAFRRTKRAVTLPATIRTRKCLCEEVECEIWVPELRASRIWTVEGVDGVPFLDAGIAVNLAAPLACRRVDQCTAHLGPARVAPAMVAVRQRSRRRQRPSAFLGTGIQKTRRRRRCCLCARTVFVASAIVAVVMLDPMLRLSFVRKRLASPLPLNPCTRRSADTLWRVDDTIHRSCTALAFTLAQP
jgi:hypothetical protein